MARIKKFDESLVGKVVWYLDPWLGIKSIKVTGIEAVTNPRSGAVKYGLYYDKEYGKGNVHKYVARILWVREHPLFNARGAVVQYYHKLLKVDGLTVFEELEAEDIDVRK